MSWTDERVARLKELVAKKWSATQIATEFGIGRNAVSGKVHRLGLRLLSTARGPKPRKMPAGLAKKLATKGARKSINPSNLRNKRQSRQNDPGLLLTRQPVAVPEPRSLNIKLLDLQDGMCKWSDCDAVPYLFCGHPTVERNINGEIKPVSFCEHHASRAYQPHSALRSRNKQAEKDLAA